MPHSDAHTIGEGLLSISSFLDSKGFSTEVFCADELYLDISDFRFNRQQYEMRFDLIRKKIIATSPRVVAVSALTPQYPMALEILALCKEIEPEILTVIGGPHATFTGTKVFDDSEYIDVLVKREGEWTMAELMERISAGQGFDDVPGLIFRKDGRIIENKDRSLGDLQTLPPVDYSKVNPEYLAKCSFFMTFTRGCPFNCSYCVESKFWGNRVRTRQVDALLKEIEYLSKHFPSNKILFLGSVFNAPEKFFREMCGQLKNMDLSGNYLHVMASAAYLPEEHVRLMAESGIKKILLAVESAAPEILKRMNKRISFDLVVEKCKLIRKYGLGIGTFWLFGHPGETEETAQTSLDAMAYLWENDLNDKQEVAVFNPYPGLPILENPAGQGFRIVNKDLSRYSRFDKPVIELDTLPYDRLKEIHQEARQIAQFWMSSKMELFSLDIANIYKKISEVKVGKHAHISQ